MFIFKCLTILGIATATTLCNDTTTVETIETTERNVSLTATSAVEQHRLVEKETIPNNVTSDSTDIVTNAVTETVITGNIYNATKHYVLQGKRKAVVIINFDSTSSLRNRGGKRKKTKQSNKKDKVETLLYEEYDTDGTVIFQFMMYNMEDVSRFFAGFLHTEICHERCEPRPEDIAREEENKAAA